MSKTQDIEYAITVALQAGPLTLQAMESRLPDPLRNEDRRWIGAAVHRMLNDGRIRTVNCASGHNHDGACVVAGGGQR